MGRKYHRHVGGKVAPKSNPTPNRTLPKKTTGSDFVDLSGIEFESLPWEPFTPNDITKLKVFCDSL